MTPTVSIDMTEFQVSFRRYLLNTSRELAAAINARFFFLLVRVFTILPPHDPQAARAKIRAYMGEAIGGAEAVDRISRRTGKRLASIKDKRILRRVNLIAQARNRAAGGKGLYGKAMRIASGKVFRRAVGSVGFLKSAVVKAIKQINGHFTQFGGDVMRGRYVLRSYSANAAAVAIAKEYGTAGNVGGNVGIHKGSWAFTHPARPGWNPVASSDIGWGVKEGQESKVNGMFVAAWQRAINDETAEMKRHLEGVLQDEIDTVSH